MSEHRSARRYPPPAYGGILKDVAAWLQERFRVTSRETMMRTEATHWGVSQGSRESDAGANRKPATNLSIPTEARRSPSRDHRHFEPATARQIAAQGEDVVAQLPAEGLRCEGLRVAAATFG